MPPCAPLPPSNQSSIVLLLYIIKLYYTGVKRGKMTWTSPFFANDRQNEEISSENFYDISHFAPESVEKSSGGNFNSRDFAIGSNRNLEKVPFRSNLRLRVLFVTQAVTSWHTCDKIQG